MNRVIEIGSSIDDDDDDDDVMYVGKKQTVVELPSSDSDEKEDGCKIVNFVLFLVFHCLQLLFLLVICQSGTSKLIFCECHLVEESFSLSWFSNREPAPKKQARTPVLESTRRLLLETQLCINAKRDPV